MNLMLKFCKRIRGYSLEEQICLPKVVIGWLYTRLYLARKSKEVTHPVTSRIVFEEPENDFVRKKAEKGQ